MRFHRKILILVILCLGGMVSCTPHTEPPSLSNSPTSDLNVEACRNSSLTFKTVNADNVRSLANCLVAGNEMLRPYKDFLDSASTEDLNSIFEAFNKYMPWGGERHTEFLDLVQLMKTKGSLRSLLSNFGVLVESQFITEGIRAALPLWEKNSIKNPDPDVAQLNLFLAQAMDNGMFHRTLKMSHLFDSSTGRALAFLLSSSLNGGMNSDQITDTLRLGLESLIRDGSFQTLIVHFGSPHILKALQGSSFQERNGFSDIFNYFSYENSQSDYEAFRKSQILTEATDAPLNCFVSKSGQALRRTDNVIGFIVDNIKNEPKGEVEDFLLKTIPLLFVSTQHLCQIPPKMVSSYDAIIDLILKGHGESYGEFWRIIDRGGRLPLFVQALKSPHFLEMLPVIGESSRRSALRAFWDLAGDDLTDFDVETLQMLLTSASVENISGPALVNWVQSRFRGSPLIKLVSELPEKDRTLENLIYKIESEEQYDSLASSLRSYLAQNHFKKSVVNSLENILSRILQGDLKAFNKSVVRVWADERGGLANTMKILSEVSSLAEKKPVLSFLSDTLKDQELINKTSPAFLRLVKNPKFSSVIDLTGSLASEGKLENLVIFFVDLLRGGAGAPVYLKPNTTKMFDSDGGALSAQKYKGLKTFPQSVVDIYGDCSTLKGDIFDPSGAVFLKATHCLNSTGNNFELETAVNILNKNKLLPQMISLLNQTFNMSPYIATIVDEVEGLLRQGVITSLLKMVTVAGTIRSNIQNQWDLLLGAFFNHRLAESVLQWIGWVSIQPQLNSNLKTLVDAGFSDPVPVYKSDNNFRLKLNDPANIKKQIANLLPGITPQELERVFLTAKENFEAHNDDWKYREGSYKKLTKDQFKSEIYGLFNDLLRPSDLEEFIGVFQDYYKDNQVLNFLKDLSSLQLVTLNDVGGTSYVHIQTGLDSLENLVLNADFGYAYISNIGTSFQLSVVNSTDFVASMKDQYSELKMGARACNLFGPANKCSQFKNMMSNFQMLNYIAANNEMKVLQRLYAGLYRATPNNLKNVLDPNMNHMGLINHFNRLGFFQSLSMSIQQTATQNKTDAIVRAVLNLAAKLKPEDMPYLRQSLKQIMDKVNSGQPNPLTSFLDFYWDLEQNPQAFEKFKTHLMHVVLAQDFFIDNLSVLLRTLPKIWVLSKTSLSVVEHMIADLKNDTSSTYQWAANLLRLDKTSSVNLKSFLDKVLSNAGTGDVVLMSAEIYEKNDILLDNISLYLKNFWNDPQVVSINPHKTFFNALNILGSNGEERWLGLGFILNNPENRKTMIEMGHVLSEQGQFKSLGEYVSRQASSGEVEKALYFLFDHFKKEPLKFH